MFFIFRTPNAAQGRVTSPWCGGETEGGFPALTRNVGGDLAQPRRPGPGIAHSTPQRPPWDSPDGTGRAPPGGGGMQEYSGFPCNTALARARVRPFFPNPWHLAFCKGTSWGGDLVTSNARPGLRLNHNGLQPGD